MLIEFNPLGLFSRSLPPAPPKWLLPRARRRRRPCGLADKPTAATTTAELPPRPHNPLPLPPRAGIARSTILLVTPTPSSNPIPRFSYPQGGQAAPWYSRANISAALWGPEFGCHRRSDSCNFGFIRDQMGALISWVMMREMESDQCAGSPSLVWWG